MTLNEVKENEETAVTTKESTEMLGLDLGAELAAFKADGAATWGAGADIEENKALFSNDYLIPKLWLIQSMSQLRLDGVATEGEYANSINGSILSDGINPINFVVVNTFKRWQTFKTNEKGKKEFVESETMTLQNANYKYEFNKDGFLHTRRQVLSYTILLAGDLQKGITRPYVLDFAGSSKRAGRVMITEINEIRDAGYPSACLVFALTSKSEKNDDGTFHVKEVKKVGLSNKTVVLKARDVYEDLKKHEDMIEIDESDLLNKTKKEAEVLPASDEV